MLRLLLRHLLIGVRNRRFFAYAQNDVNKKNN